MAYVFGPVRSRRLGRSLGIDPIPLKTCNWNCVYCQLGRTVPLNNTRAEYYPAEAVVMELRRALDTSADIDWITFVGSGEPTLHSRIGWLIRQARSLADIPVAVITNGSLLHIPEVAQELAAADAVLPTLDAGDSMLYCKLNRPHPGLSYDSLRQGLARFHRHYEGLFWVEVMLVEGMNDGEQALQSLAVVLDEIEPDEVHINVPFRAPAESWVRVPAPDTLRRAREIIGSDARLIEPAPADFEAPQTNSLDSLAEVVARHPLPDEEVLATFAACGEDPETAVRELANDKRVARVERLGRQFWCPARATYADRQAGRRREPEMMPLSKGRQGGKS
jgi:wyosine [tRNA(Phe)-imidazoG37] synthetase (radical SAM superfamily)